MTRGLALVLASGLLVSLPVVLAVSCGDSGEEEGTAHGGQPHDHDGDIGLDSGALCPTRPASTLTYGNFAKEFFTTYCNRCHSSSAKGDARKMAPTDHNFDTLEQIELLAKHIDQYAAAGPTRTNDQMPPNDPKPSGEDRMKLGEWIACGLRE